MRPGPDGRATAPRLEDRLQRMFQRGSAALNRVSAVRAACRRGAAVAFGNTRRGIRQTVCRLRSLEGATPLDVRLGDCRGAAKLEAQAGSTCRDDGN